MDRKDKVKKYFQKSEVWTTIILVIAILAVVNFLSYQIFARWDITENNIYSLSEASKKTAQNLDDIVNVKVYFSKDLPAHYINTRQRVSDVLDEYKAYSDGNIRVEFIHPEEKWDDPRSKLAPMGIPEVQFNVVEKGSYQVSRGYMGISVQYGANNESIPVVKQEEDPEYKITTAIKKATQEKLTRVGFLVDEGLPEPEKDIKTAYQKLGGLYEITKVDIGQRDEIPSNIATLIIPGPEKEFTEEQLKALDNYLMKGGNIFFLADGVVVDNDNGLLASPNETNLNELLENYGVRLKNDLVLDENASQVSFTSGFMAFRREYPLWPKVVEENFNPDEPATADLKSLTLSWASSIETLEEKPADVDISYLAKTSENSWSQESSFRLSPDIDFQPPADTEQRDLAVKISGNLKSAYGEGETDQGKIVLIGDSDFIKEKFLEEGKSNRLTFFQNVVGDLSLEDNLISMRSKKISERSLTDLSGDEKQLIKYANILIVPIVVIIVGMLRYYLRKRSAGIKSFLKRKHPPSQDS